MGQTRKSLGKQIGISDLVGEREAEKEQPKKQFEYTAHGAYREGHFKERWFCTCPMGGDHIYGVEWQLEQRNGNT
jgi:hypothetical protein